MGKSEKPTRNHLRSCRQIQKVRKNIKCYSVSPNSPWAFSIFLLFIPFPLWPIYLKVGHVQSSNYNSFFEHDILPTYTKNLINFSWISKWSEMHSTQNICLYPMVICKIFGNRYVLDISHPQRMTAMNHQYTHTSVYWLKIISTFITELSNPCPLQLRFKHHCMRHCTNLWQCPWPFNFQPYKFPNAFIHLEKDNWFT